MDRLTHLLSYLLTYLLTHLLTYSLIDYTSPYEDTDDDGSCCCGWVTKAHLETFLYWAILCCVRRRDARRNIKYSNYKPLQKKRSNQQDDDYDDGPLTYSLTHLLIYLLTYLLAYLQVMMMMMLDQLTKTMKRANGYEMCSISALSTSLRTSYREAVCKRVSLLFVFVILQ